MNQLGNLLYSWVHSVLFWVVVIMLLMVWFGWKKKRDVLLSALSGLITKPVIFEEDSDPESVRFYQRRFLEKIASGLKTHLVDPFGTLANNFKRSILQQGVTYASDKEHPWRTFMPVFMFAMLVVFIFADAIAIVNTLQLLQLVEVVPVFLRNYGIAATLGSLAAFVIGIFVLTEVLAKESKYSTYSEKDPVVKDIIKFLAVYLSIFGLLVVIFLGLDRAVMLGWIPESDIISVGAKVATMVFVPLNTVIATALIFDEGIKGFVTILIVTEWILYALLVSINYLTHLLGGLALPFLLDIVIRLLLIIIYLLFYIIVTPIDFLIYIITFPARMFRPKTTQ